MLHDYLTTLLVIGVYPLVILTIIGLISAIIVNKAIKDYKPAKN